MTVKAFVSPTQSSFLLSHTPKRSKKRPSPCAVRASAENAFIGIDFGTSGARSIVIDAQGSVLSSSKASYTSTLPDHLATTWQSALFQLLQDIPSDVKQRAKTLAIDGTSSTTLLIDAATGGPLPATPPKMYNDAQHPEIVEFVKTQIAPADHTAAAPTSTLCKVVSWWKEGKFLNDGSVLVLHQSDWLSSLLTGYRGVTDWNNALKLGFDPGTEEYPDWLADCGLGFIHALPQVVCAPGTPLAPVTPEIASKTGLSSDCIVCAGTTDSIAAFLAAQVTEPGQAVSSLGSTLAIKLLSETRVDDAKYGIYSHRLGDMWLVGGASNSGGGVLRKFFTDEQLQQLTRRILEENPGLRKPTGLGDSYVVLPAVGERFPVNDPNLRPHMEPRPEDDAVFLQALFESMANTEGIAYRKLAELGATPVCEVWTAGGGAQNPVWMELRARAIGVPVGAARQGEAAYGAAVLARSGWELLQQESSPLLM